MRIDKKINDVKWFVKDSDTYVSEPLVMESAAGWYIGKICEVIYEYEDGIQKCVEPWEKCTEYMTYDEAKRYMESMERLEENHLDL